MERYIEGSLIGSGTYAKVYKAVDMETGKNVALKRIELNGREGMPSTALREISILRNLSHKNIIPILQIIHCENRLTIVFEYMNYDLMAYIEKHGNVMFLINQLVSGIHHLHMNSIVHRDLKPQNILVNSSGILKIADFGLARMLSATDAGYSSEVVTLWYRAPELLMGSTNYGCEIDIWSFGCIVYDMIVRKPLLPGENNSSQLILCNQLSLRRLENDLVTVWRVPKFLARLVCKCLHPLPANRITADEIVASLETKYGSLQ
ncbi:negative regulator of the PHO system [Pancytospora epiphaga]|nr:negative regulator of the PHO system [Pancytospora epiphaga]